MILEPFGELLDDGTSSEISECSGEEDEGKVGLVFACDLGEVYNDRPHSCDYCTVERKDNGIHDKVYVF